MIQRKLCIFFAFSKRKKKLRDYSQFALKEMSHTLRLNSTPAPLRTHTNKYMHKQQHDDDDDDDDDDGHLDLLCVALLTPKTVPGQKPDLEIQFVRQV
ncbi:unnamed protein product [Protopolystoma xenopodis]|uniref:Uncharacterized protein n=1 Tax=Protopolystoma xenopodis TaxID=117903 RepID=A0A3S5CF10_9PLAT|nr:unnamed protein product [Protopolystoma xenopodis]